LEHIEKLGLTTTRCREKKKRGLIEISIKSSRERGKGEGGKRKGEKIVKSNYIVLLRWHGPGKGRKAVTYQTDRALFE